MSEVIENIYELDTIFTFGKHKGKSLKEIIDLEPSYIKWCHSHIQDFKIDSESLKLIYTNNSKITLSDNLVSLLENINSELSNMILDLVNSCQTKLVSIELTQQSDMCMITDTKGRIMLSSIGRIVSCLLTDNFKKVHNKDLEKFVNTVRSINEMMNLEFILIEGKEIKKYYNEESYENINGTLGNSCMRYSSCKSYFKLYTKNKNCKLLILKQKDSEKILGRSLIWSNVDILKSDDGTTHFDMTLMDRIYSTKEHYVELFKYYATQQNWMFKISQNTDHCGSINLNGKIISNPYISIKVGSKKFDKYPYLDTLPFLNMVDGKLQNFINQENDYYILRSTGGEREEY